MVADGRRTMGATDMFLQWYVSAMDVSIGVDCTVTVVSHGRLNGDMLL
jgi:hypothetical protein